MQIECTIDLLHMLSTNVINNGAYYPNYSLAGLSMRACVYLMVYPIVILIRYIVKTVVLKRQSLSEVHNVVLTVVLK